MDIRAASILFLILLLRAEGGPLGILELTHKYSHKEGSSKRNVDRGMSPEHRELLLNHDRGRRGRFLQGVTFPLGGYADPTTGGLYFTQVGLGNPVKEYIVQVDTGSDVLWVNCSPCISCPPKSDLRIPLTLYNPQKSSSAATVACADQFCVVGTRASEASCSRTGNCEYTFQYGDGSTTSGHYVRDVMQFRVVENGASTNGTARVLFGCSTTQTGDLTSSEQAVDGIMGFGQLALSVPSQLAAQQKIPKVFFHCLEGEAKGGGILGIGQVNETGVVYTPLVPNSTHYNVNLVSISVAGSKLSISKEEFSSTDTSGVIFDSGTTLAYLPNAAFNAFVNAILQATSVQTFTVESTYCFIVPGSLGSYFPTVTLHFDGDVTMELDPENYLIFQAIAKSGRSVPVWCMGWQSSSSADGPKDDVRLTIFGDLVLKNKLVVYDLDNSRIGWMNYNCSSNVIVGDQSISATHLDSSDTSLMERSMSFFLAAALLLVSLVQ